MFNAFHRTNMMEHALHILDHNARNQKEVKMALKKSDLYSSLWSACDDLRGPMDPSQYKDYVLVLLFIKYISDKYSGVKYSPIEIPKGASFADLVALKGTDDIGDQINKKIIDPLAKANNLTDLPDFNDPGKLGAGKEMVDRLTNLIGLFETRLDFSKNDAGGDDILGDAYEYLMRHFATESGKSKGQFYTPAEVSRIMARLVGINNSTTSNETTVYDPTCGSGSLLLKVADEAAEVSGAKVTLYGQENEATTAGLARMNMILHDNPTADIRQGNTITTPHFKNGDALKTFDYVVANPPFSDKRWSTGVTDDNDFGRFSVFGRPPAKQGDYAYLLHIIASLKSTGQGACILPHGVLFRGNAEAVIRRNLVQRGYIKAIIGLPANLFYGTGIPACLVVIDKKDASARKGIFMVNASSGFQKDGNKNRLREQDIHRIIDAYRHQTDVPGFAQMVPVTDIADPKNDYNLNIPRYIDSVETEDIQDVVAHMKGGIPDRDIESLEKYWRVMPGLHSQLFERSDRPGYQQLCVPDSDVRSTISVHPDFIAFRKAVESTLADWRRVHEPVLRSYMKDDSPKKLIVGLSESLLQAFGDVGLLDPNDIYQGLMEFWAETMQDDAYMISADGWVDAAAPREITQQRNRDNKLVWVEVADFLIERRRFRSDLLPASILVEEFFPIERDAITALTTELETVEQGLESEKEEHAAEGGLLEDVAEFADDKVKITLKEVTKWLKENSNDPDISEEIAAITRYKDLLICETSLKDAIKTAVKELDKKLADKYAELTEVAVKDLVVSFKWLGRVEANLSTALVGAELALATRILELEKRYQATIPSQDKIISDLIRRVGEHLHGLGIS